MIAVNKNNVYPLCLAAIIVLFTTGCGQAGSPTRQPPARKKTDRQNHAPASYAYVLQADKLATTREVAVKVLAGCDRDWIILDSACTTGPGGRWTWGCCTGLPSPTPRWPPWG